MPSSRSSPAPSPAASNPVPELAMYACVFGLVALGLTVLYSATRAEPSQLLNKQVIWLGFALLAGAAATLFPLGRLRSLTWPAGLASLALLGLVLVPGIGVMVNGAQRWIGLGEMRLQVAEPAKIGLVLVLAGYLGANRRRARTFLRGFVVPCLIIAAWCGLVFLQPDYGTAALCGAAGLCLVFLAGARLRYVIPATGLGVALFSLAVYHDPVRWRRITAFLDVEGNRQDGAYQLWQGLLAFGAGGVRGAGLGNGRQQLHFLPEAHTDFIFAVVGEELGLVFTAGTVLAFLTIFLLGVWRLRRAPDLHQFLVVQGALLFIALQALINFGVVTGLIPTKGLSLPFISYGGSNLVVMFFFVGLILNALRNWEGSLWQKPREI